VRAAFAVVCVIASTAPAAAEPMRVVVRHAGGADDVAVARLEGHIVDLDVEPVEVTRPLEKTLDAQIAAASELADEHDARAIVWFRAEPGGLGVVVATPADRRVFARTIDAGDASATAEAAAQAARTAIRAIALGGTIGIEMPAETRPEEPPPPPRVPGTRTRWEGAIGWQVAVDGGADVGAHALAQRIAIARGPWAGGLALTLGPPLRRDDEIAVELARSTAILAIERRVGSLGAALGAGAALYHRATVAVPGDLAPTDSQAALAFAATLEVRWRAWSRGAWAIEASLGVDLIVGAPDLQIERDGMTETLAEIAELQPRLALGIVVSP
jgi:hypothetical protein